MLTEIISLLKSHSLIFELKETVKLNRDKEIEVDGVRLTVCLKARSDNVQDKKAINVL